MTTTLPAGGKPSGGPSTGSPLLEFESLTVDYRGPDRKPFHAVDNVSFAVSRGETVGLVGESGSGKTTIGSTAVGLARVTSGTVRFDGQDITKASAATRRKLSARLQVIFQDPYSSLNPLRTVGQTLVEPLLVHQKIGRKEADTQVSGMLQRVGLDPAASARYPTAFSGGQRQRIAIARALMVSPDLVICDEAVSALDLSVQAQVLNLLLGLQEEYQVSYLFISHNLSVIRHMADRIVVLYRGQTMEVGDSGTVHDRPSHPYTQALLSASPIPNPRAQASQREHLKLALRPARPRAPTSFCRFANRCPFATEICEQQTPPLVTGPTGTDVACHHVQEALAHVTVRTTRAQDPTQGGDRTA
jgi:oligopeptide/dipeptide ABC transporter ATP-binding protein